MKKFLSILTMVMLTIFCSCSNDEPITTKTETMTYLKSSEEPETYIDNIDYSLIEDKYPDTNISVLEEQLYQISMGNITPICSKTEIKGNGKTETTVYSIGLSFCIQKVQHSIKNEEDFDVVGWIKSPYPEYSLNFECKCP